MKRVEVTRRDFLKIIGAATVVTIPALSGYGLLKAAEGESPPKLEPYDNNVINNIDFSGAPILILINQSSKNPFGAYLGEILRAEGLNGFQLIDISMVNTDLLNHYEIVLLAEGELNTNQIELIESFVYKGGRIVAMRPQLELEAILGVERTSGSISDGYLKTEREHAIADGIVTESLQFHGTADQYRLAGAQAIAWLDQDRDVGKRYPAVTLNEFGTGQAAMWAFDLAKSVPYTRQGNPEWANQERDGFSGIRTVDQFTGWIDLDRIHIPQADEQQRLLINLLVRLSQDRTPLPRLWYFPGKEKGMLVATGDSHMNPAPHIEEVLSIVENHNGHFTVYYSPEIVSNFGRALRKVNFWVSDHIPYMGDQLRKKFTSPTPSLVSNWRTRGHEFTLHPFVEAGLEAGWQQYWQEFTGRGYGPIAPTVRTHRILWTGWVETAKIQSSYGMGMNMDFYHVGPSLQNDNLEWVYGHLTGSGLPMKFVDESGKIVEIYQQLTQLADEHLIQMDVPGWGGWPNLSPFEAVEISKFMLDDSITNGGYSVIVGQFHVDPFQIGGEPAEKARIFLQGTLDYANTLGIPIWTAQKWLEFTDSRHDMDFSDFQWNQEEMKLTCSIRNNINQDHEFDLMVPFLHSGKEIAGVEVDGNTIRQSKRIIGGVKYACITVDSQSHKLSVIYH